MDVAIRGRGFIELLGPDGQILLWRGGTLAIDADGMLTAAGAGLPLRAAAPIPAGAGALKLEDPRLPMMMAAPVRRDDAPEGLRPFVEVAPAPGLLLLWESWLRHEVRPGSGRSERLISGDDEEEEQGAQRMVR